MKKIITICLLSILMLSGNVQAGNYNKVNVNPGFAASTSVWIKIILNFHRPKLDCLRGFGICLDFEVGYDKPAGLGSEGCPVLARINPEGKLELKISGSDLLKYEKGSSLPYFKQESITIEDAYTFSQPVARQLVTDRQLTVKPGTYPVTFDPSSQTYTVTFSL